MCSAAVTEKKLRPVRVRCAGNVKLHRALQTLRTYVNRTVVADRGSSLICAPKRSAQGCFARNDEDIGKASMCIGECRMTIALHLKFPRGFSLHARDATGCMGRHSNASFPSAVSNRMPCPVSLRRSRPRSERLYGQVHPGQAVGRLFGAPHSSRPARQIFGRNPYIGNRSARHFRNGGFRHAPWAAASLDWC